MNTGYYTYGVADYMMPRRANGLPHIAKHRIKVEIISTGCSRTKIRFLEWHTDGRGPGTTTTVKNRNVSYDKINVNPAATAYRLPYKDD